MRRSNTYNIFASHRDGNAPSTLKCLQPRIKSLQKIKVNRRGLPSDFFKPNTTRQTFNNPPLSLRMATLPVQFEDIRATPKFSEAQTMPFTEKRQSKSQERIKKEIKQLKKPISPFVEWKSDVTFHTSTKTREPQKKPQIITLKIKKQEILLKTEPKQCKEEPSTNHEELSDLIKRKNAFKQKYSKPLYMRTEQRRQNKLPILKANYPSAFGV